MVDAVPSKRLVVVARDLAREHVLARVLVDAVTDEALLVAVVDHRHAAQQEQHGVRQHHALQDFLVARAAAARVRTIHAKPAEIMVAGERGQAQRRAARRLRTARRPAYRRASTSVPALPRQHLLDGAREAEVQHRGQLVDARVARELRHVDASAATSPKMWKLGMPARARAA